MTLLAAALVSSDTNQPFDAFANAIAILRGTLNVREWDECKFTETTQKVHLRMRSLYSWQKPVIIPAQK
jgi:hypothetical protein